MSSLKKKNGKRLGHKKEHLLIHTQQMFYNVSGEPRWCWMLELAEALHS